MLREEQRSYPLTESARSGLSIGELVRRAIDATCPTAAHKHLGASS
jgi:hypothetical protein